MGEAGAARLGFGLEGGEAGAAEAAAAVVGMARDGEEFCLVEDDAAFTASAPNITPMVETGIAGCTDADVGTIVAFLRTLPPLPSRR